MNQKSKYYFLLNKLILWFIFILIIGALLKIATIYQYIEPNAFAAIKIIMVVINSLLIIAVSLIAIYLVYQVYSYRSSAFYKTYKINIFEALFHGILDMYLVYDKVQFLADSKTIKVDFKNNIITFVRKNKYYSFLFIDLFGRIDGKEKSDFWFSLRKPKKKFGRKIYAKKIKFSNPILVNQRYVEELKSQTGKDYQNCVVITGFYNMKFKSKNIVSPYEITTLID